MAMKSSTSIFDGPAAPGALLSPGGTLLVHRARCLHLPCLDPAPTPVPLVLGPAPAPAPDHASVDALAAS